MSCNFDNYLNPALHDQFVCGLQDARVQQELLSIKDLMMTRALEKAQAMEVVSRETCVFQQSEKDEVSPFVHEDQFMDTLLISKATAPCIMVYYRCGNKKHAAAKCPHKDKKCNNC